MKRSQNTLFLHVGMHKTGTTSIQRFLQKNKGDLKSRRLAYLDGPEANHSLLALSVFEEQAWGHCQVVQPMQRFFYVWQVMVSFRRHSLPTG